MASSYTLDAQSRIFIDAQVASGRYGSTSEVLDDALRPLRDRLRRQAALDDDLDAGRVHDADAVFDDLEARHASPVLHLAAPRVSDRARCPSSASSESVNISNL